MQGRCVYVMPTKRSSELIRILCILSLTANFAAALWRESSYYLYFISYVSIFSARPAFCGSRENMAVVRFQKARDNGYN
ncbi:hypothetical protein F4814DRAFT_425133 [Daldinia grandis]|nr:hypothetical protein F4814DRAFT_425133 [Daldinia grandis]